MPDSIQIKSDKLSELPSRLVENPGATRINVIGSELDVENALHLNSALSGDAPIVTLTLRKIRMPLDTFGVLANGVGASQHLKELSLADSYINSDMLPLLVAALKANRSLKSINLSGCQLEPEGIIEIAGALVSNPGIEQLDLSNNNGNIPAVLAIATALRDGSGLLSLNLSQFKFNLFERGEEYSLEDALSQLIDKTALTTLDLTGNHYCFKTFIGVRFAAALQNNLYLKNLILRDMQLGDSAMVILEALKSSMVEVLDLSMNSLGVGIKPALNQLIRTSQFIKFINIKNTNCSLDDNDSDLREAIRCSDTLVTIIGDYRNSDNRYKQFAADDLQNNQLKLKDTALQAKRTGVQHYRRFIANTTMLLLTHQHGNDSIQSLPRELLISIVAFYFDSIPEDKFSLAQSGWINYRGRLLASPSFGVLSEGASTTSPDDGASPPSPRG